MNTIENTKRSIQTYITTIYMLAIASTQTIINQFTSFLSVKRSGVADLRMVVYLIIAFLIAAILFPIAMNQVTAAVTTSWGAGVAPVYVSLLPILVIISIALHFLGFV